MNIYTTVTNKLTCSMYWGERTLIEENVPATLHWQPLQEAQGSFRLDPDFFNRPFWNQYRPDSEQKLFFTSVNKKWLQRIWIDEYDVRAYVRGWKNVPSFRLKRIEFVSKTDQNSKKIPWQQIESWFLIPGEITSQTSKKLESGITVPFQAVGNSCRLDELLFKESLDHLDVEIYTGKMKPLPVTAICLKNCKSLQPETTTTYRDSLKTEYDIAIGLLMLFVKQNLTPVWQLVGDNNNWQEFCFYESKNSRRNLVDSDFTLKWNDKSIRELHSAITNRSLSAFTNYIDDINAFTNLLAIENLLKRFEKAIELLNRLIGWSGTDLNRWPEVLNDVLDNYQVKKKKRFVDSPPEDWEKIRDPWNTLASPLQSFYSLIAGKSPSGSWFNGKKMKKRNEFILELLTEMILAKHWSATDSKKI